MSAKKARRAVGIVRVSRTKGAGIVSPSEQRQRIEDLCEREGWILVDVFEELDVSGGRDLAKRPGLNRAVEMTEAGEADVIAAAYLDRLLRSTDVKAEFGRRVKAAKARVWTVDIGEITNGSAAKELEVNVMVSVAQYLRETTAERTQEAKRRAIADGVPTFDRIPPGYYRPAGQGKQRFARVPLQVDPVAKPIVEEAWQMRARGASIDECRRFMREGGVDVSYSVVTGMFHSRIYLGELHFGQLENLHAHEPIIDRATWRRVQGLVLLRGRKPKSDRLLARLGVLRCETCGARMIVGQTRANGRDYAMYRCPPNGDCPRRVTISAAIVEPLVTQATQELLEGVQGSASVDDGIADAERELGSAEQELDAAVRAFSGLDDVPSAQERLLELRDARDVALDRLDDLRSATAPAITVSADDWDDLLPEERRGLIRAVIERVTVAPGRGPDRVTVEPRGQ